MKRTIAVVCAAALIAVSFTGCKKNIIIDEHGDEHKMVMKNGDPVQDEYGNIIEKITNKDGKKAEGSVTFPVVMKSDKKTIQNAAIKMNIPDKWKFDENIKAFRLQHADCTGDAVCEINVEIQDHMTVEEEYRRKLAAQQAVFYVSGDESFNPKIEESTTKLFGKETKVFKSVYEDSVYYYYIFDHSRYTVGFSFILNNECFDENFKPEDFIKENVTLKTIPTER